MTIQDFQNINLSSISVGEFANKVKATSQGIIDDKLSYIDQFLSNLQTETVANIHYDTTEIADILATVDDKWAMAKVWYDNGDDPSYNFYARACSTSVPNAHKILSILCPTKDRHYRKVLSNNALCCVSDSYLSDDAPQDYSVECRDLHIGFDVATGISRLSIKYQLADATFSDIGTLYVVEYLDSDSHPAALIIWRPNDQIVLSGDEETEVDTSFVHPILISDQLYDLLSAFTIQDQYACVKSQLLSDLNGLYMGANVPSLSDLLSVIDSYRQQYPGLEISAIRSFITTNYTGSLRSVDGWLAYIQSFITDTSILRDSTDEETGFFAAKGWEWSQTFNIPWETIGSALAMIGGLVAACSSKILGAGIMLVGAGMTVINNLIQRATGTEMSIDPYGCGDYITNYPVYQGKVRHLMDSSIESFMTDHNVGFVKVNYPLCVEYVKKISNDEYGYIYLVERYVNILQNPLLGLMSINDSNEDITDFFGKLGWQPASLGPAPSYTAGGLNDQYLSSDLKFLVRLSMLPTPATLESVYQKFGNDQDFWSYLIGISYGLYSLLYLETEDRSQIRWDFSAPDIRFNYIDDTLHGSNPGQPLFVFRKSGDGSFGSGTMRGDYCLYTFMAKWAMLCDGYGLSDVAPSRPLCGFVKDGVSGRVENISRFYGVYRLDGYGKAYVDITPSHSTTWNGENYHHEDYYDCIYGLFGMQYIANWDDYVPKAIVRGPIWEALATWAFISQYPGIHLDSISNLDTVSPSRWQTVNDDIINIPNQTAISSNVVNRNSAFIKIPTVSSRAWTYFWMGVTAVAVVAVAVISVVSVLKVKAMRKSVQYQRRADAIAFDDAYKGDDISRMNELDKQVRKLEKRAKFFGFLGGVNLDGDAISGNFSAANTNTTTSSVGTEVNQELLNVINNRLYR